LDRWEVHAKLSEEKKQQRELWAKEILKKEEKKTQKIEKTNELKMKRAKDEWAEFHEKRDERKNKYNMEIRNRQKETWQSVKEYYNDVKEFHAEKLRKEKLIYAKMMETYDSYKGSKA
jgi:hypothetical protein